MQKKEKVTGIPRKLLSSYGRRLRLRNTASTLRRLPNLGKFYRAPVPLQGWNEEQLEVHPSWAELFFDLIFVGVVFKEGNLIADAFSTSNLGTGIAVFLTTFVCMFDCWSLRMTYNARFFTNDIYHKIGDILVMLLIANAAQQLGTLDDFLDLQTYRMFSFSLSLTLLSAYEIVNAWDLYKNTDMTQIAGIAENTCRRICIPFILFIISCFTSYPSLVESEDFGANASTTTLALWFSAIAIYRLDLYVRIYFGQRLPQWFIGKVGQLYSVPLNIMFVIQRYGEWTMLMMGEGVLQLIIADFKASTESYLTFILGYLLMASLQLLHYAREPDHAEGHAMRRSGRRAWFWMNVQTLYSASLTCVGVGLKLVLKYSGDAKYLKKYTPLLNLACALSLLLLSLSRLCHNGVQEFSDRPLAKAVIWLLYLAIAGALAAAGFAPLGAAAMVALNVVAVAASFLLQVVERRHFGDTVHVGHSHASQHGRSDSASLGTASTDEFVEEFLDDLENAGQGEEGPGREPKKNDCDATGVPFCRSWNDCAMLSVERRIELAEKYVATLRRRQLKTEAKSSGDEAPTPILEAAKDDTENEVMIC